MRYLTYDNGKLFINGLTHTNEFSRGDLRPIKGGDFIILANLSS